MFGVWVGGHEDGNPDDPFLNGAALIDEPVAPGPLGRDRREDLQIYSALAGLTLKGFARNPLRVEVGADPPDRWLMHSDRRWAVENFAHSKTADTAGSFPSGLTSTCNAKPRSGQHDQPTQGKRGRLHLPLPQRVRRLRLGHHVYGKTRDEVHDKWIRLHNQAKAGPVATKVPTVAEFVTYWLREIVQPNLAPLTAATYETMARLYIVPGLGAKHLDRLTVRDVQTWINQIPKACQCCLQGKDAKRREDRRRCCAIGKCCHSAPSALSQAVREELIGKNVAVPIKLPTSRPAKRKSWTSAEARRFLESARAAGDPFYAGYVLVLVLGYRKGEILGLTWDDVDLDKGELTIEWQLQRIRGQLLHRETKTEASDATLPLPKICVTALRLRKAEQETAEAKAGQEWHETRLVFTARYGTPIEPRNFSRSYENRIAKAQVRQITVHDARRTCGTLLADLDVHPRVAMAILRHAKFSVTMEIYTQVSDEQTREALRKLGDSLDG